MTTQLDAIAALKDGWWGPGSEAIDTRSVAIVRVLVPFMCGLQTPIGISPHEGGALMLEWNNGGAEFTVEIFSAEMILTTDDEDNDVYFENHVPATAAELRRFIAETAS